MRTFPGFDGRVQFLASRGYAVLQPNFRGSRGYGKQFMNAGDRQWGRGVMQTDVTNGVDFLVGIGVAVRSRVAIMGGSYGGYAALAGLTFTPDRYAAAVSLFGPSDLLAFAKGCPVEWQAYAGDQARRLGYADTAEARAALADLSPVSHASEATAPLLIYHGAIDPLIPADHSLKMVAALKAAGKEANLLLSPTEGHGFSAPTTEMAVYRAIETFLGPHLGGQVGGQPNQPVQTALGELQTAGQNPWKR